MNRLLAALALALATASAAAQYSDECRDLARRMAVEPGALTAPELDLVRDCVSSLQRARLLGESVPPGEPLPCAAAAPVPAECPVCPEVAAQACARATPPPAVRPARERARDTGEDRRPRTYIPKY